MLKNNGTSDHPVEDTNEFFISWIMLAQARDAVLKARQRDYAQFEINNERRAVLWCIQNNGGQATPVEISVQLFHELHSVTEMLNRMVKEGLLKKYKGTGRSRAVVRLTKKGSEVFRQSLYDKTDQRIFSVLTSKEREKLRSYLWKIRNNALKELGIPEWKIKFPLNPDVTNGEEAVESNKPE
jgi:DNA-binding MarR family transcriptional regulator